MSSSGEAGPSSEGKEKKRGKKTKEERTGVENAWSVSIPKFQKGDMKHSLVDVTEFRVNFPEYREPYLKTSLPILKKIMKEQGIDVEMDALKGSLIVKTTKDTWDPYAIMLARDVIKLISRHVSLEKAVKVFEEGITSEIINIRGMVRDKEVFKKRRNRLLGKENIMLTILQKVTQCEVVVQGGTVAAIGPYKGVLSVMSVVKDTMKNEHPYYLVKNLWIKHNLQNDPKMQDEDWSKYLPEYVVKNQKANKKKKKKKVKKEYNPFPPAPTESKVDKQIEEGEYFVQDIFKKGAFNKEEQKKKSKKKQAAKRAAQFIAPEEPVAKKAKLSDPPKEDTSKVDVEKVKKKLKSHKKKMKD